MSPEAAVKYLNDLYIGFNESDSSSPLGVTISMAAINEVFFGNFFCHDWPNPAGKTSCFKGQADCRLSASLYNHKMMISNTTSAPMIGLGRKWGMVINQSQVENAWAKCSYIWDGATSMRLNRGCGLGAPSATCEQPRSAYDNICNSGKVCTAADEEVQSEICVGGGGTVPVPPTRQSKLCFFPGPALDYHQQDTYEPGESKYLRTMVEQRMKYNGGLDKEGSPNCDKWNEVVIDELLFLPDMMYDPALAIPAIVYVKDDPVAKGFARQVRDQFAKDAQVGKIPIIMVDTEKYHPGGPFSYEKEDTESNVTIV